MDEVDSLLRAAYGLRLLKPLTWLKGGMTSNGNARIDVVQLDADGKDTGEPLVFMLKLCAEKTGADFDSWVAGLRHMQKHGYTTCYPRWTRDGRTAMTADGRSVLVFDFLQGAAPSVESMTPAMAFQIGESLAKLNSLPLPAPEDGIPHISQSGASSIGLARQLLPEIRACPRGGPEFADFMEEGLARLPDVNSRDLTQALLHNDVFADNTIFTADGALVAIVDFEEMCVGPRMLDLAVTVLGCCYHPAKTPATEGGQLDVPLARELVRGYVAAVHPPLDARAERARIGEYLQLGCLLLAMWRFRHFNGASTPCSDSEAQRYLETVHRCRDLACRTDLHSALFD